MRAGLTHENVCEDCVPAVVALSYMTFPDMCVTILAAVVMIMVDRAFTTFFNELQASWQKNMQKAQQEDVTGPETQGQEDATGPDQVMEVPEPMQVVNLYFQLLVILNILKFALSILSGCGATCRFVVLNSPLLFAPYLYSMAVCTLGWLSRPF